VDYRTRIEKLRAMAAQSSSPHEAEIARRKLLELGASVQPDADYGRQYRAARMGRRTTGDFVPFTGGVTINVGGFNGIYVNWNPPPRPKVRLTKGMLRTLLDQLAAQWGLTEEQVTWNEETQTGTFANDRVIGQLFWNGEFVDVNYDDRQ
jgi:hypothetical protein